MSRCPLTASLARASVLVWSLSSACQPVLSEAVLQRHQVRPARDFSEVVLEQSGALPNWLQGGSYARIVVLTGEGEGPDRATAQTLAQSDLTRRVHETLGVGVLSAYESRTTAKGGARLDSRSRQSTRMQSGAALVVPDATYWQRVKRTDGIKYRAYARRVIARSELARRGRHRQSGEAAVTLPVVILNLRGPRAEAVTLSLFFAGQGATRYRVKDPRTAVPDQGPGQVIVQGELQSSDPLVYELRTEGGGRTQVSAPDWNALSAQLPLALHRLLVPKGGLQ